MFKSHLAYQNVFVVQLVEHVTFNHGVEGSSPSRHTKLKWGYSSDGRASALQAEGHRFDSVYLHQYG